MNSMGDIPCYSVHCWSDITQVEHQTLNLNTCYSPTWSSMSAFYLTWFCVYTVHCFHHLDLLFPFVRCLFAFPFSFPPDSPTTPT